MQSLRNQVGRVTEAFNGLFTSNEPTSMENESASVADMPASVADKPASTEAPWTTHDANIALYHTLTQSSSSTASRPALPPEIIFQILEHPSRLILTNCISAKYHEDGPLRAHSHNSPRRAIGQPPLSINEARKIRKVLFEMKGKDQGWSGYRSHHGTYENTWSWYEAVVRRELVEEGGYFVEVFRLELHRNRHAGQQIETYRTEFDLDHDLVKTLKDDDVIDLDACARFPGWECQVYEASIEVWSVDDLSGGKEISSKDLL